MPLQSDPLNAPSQKHGKSDDATAPATVPGTANATRKDGHKKRYVHKNVSMHRAGASPLRGGAAAKPPAIAAEGDDVSQGISQGLAFPSRGLLAGNETGSAWSSILREMGGN